MHWTRAAGATLVLASALSGCGGSGPTAIEVVLNASTKTQAAHTARVGVTISIQDQTITSAGITDFANKQETATTKVPGVGSLYEIVDDGTAYLRLPPKLAALDNTQWIKLDLATGLQALTGVNANTFSQNTTDDPTAALDYLRGASDDMHKVGSDTTRGAATTHYRGTLDLDLASTKASTPARRKGLLQLEKVIGVNHFAVNVWIDSDGRLRKLQYRLDASKIHTPAGAAQVTGFANYSFEFYDFGAAFSLPALPRGSQVTDITGRLAGGIKPAATPPLSGRSLTEAVIPPPAGYAVSSEPEPKIGPIDAAGFNEMMGEKNGAQQSGFVTGYDKTFDSTTGADSVEVTLLQFTSPTAASSFDQSVVSALLSHGAVVKNPLPAAVAFTSKPNSGGHYEHTIIARKGDRVMVIDAFNRTSTPNPVVATVAAEQYPPVAVPIPAEPRWYVRFMSDYVIPEPEPKEIDETLSMELRHLSANAVLKAQPSGDEKCENCRYYLEPTADLSYCWHPKLRILVGAEWWCQWWDAIPEE